MKNIQTYCNNILYLIEKYGEEYINHLRWEVVSADDFLGNGSPTSEKEKPFEGNIQLANDLGQLCDNYREECISGIKDKILDMSLSKQNSYAKALLDKMWYIQLNQSIGKTSVFKRIVIPEVFIPIIDILKEQGININKIVSECRSKSGDGFCSWISLKETVSNDKSIQEQDQKEAFRNLFKEEYCKYVKSFIKRLEEEGIVKDRMCIYSKKNYLAKLFAFMKSKGIIISQKDTQGLKSFYEYFGFTVCEKIEDKRNGVTIRNLTTVCNKGVNGLSEEEKKQFNLICSVFLFPERE